MKKIVNRLALAALLLTNPLAAQALELDDLAYRQKLGDRLPSQSTFVDADGRAVAVEDIGRGAPLVLTLGYFACRKLCDVLRVELLRDLEAAGLVAGVDYTFAAVSVDPAETRATAAAAKASDLQQVPSAGGKSGWRYLTGGKADVEALAQAVGYQHRDEAQRDARAHSVGVVIVTPGGQISSYLLGLGHAASELRGAVALAAAGDVARPAEPVLLLCFDFDPTTGKYSLAIMKTLRVAAILTVVAFAAAWLYASRKGDLRA